MNMLYKSQVAQYRAPTLWYMNLDNSTIMVLIKVLSGGVPRNRPVAKTVLAKGVFP